MKQMFSENEILKMISENALNEEQVDDIALDMASMVCNNYAQITLKNDKLYIYSLGFNHKIAKASGSALNKIMTQTGGQTQDTEIYFFNVSSHTWICMLYDQGMTIGVYYLNGTTHQLTYQSSFDLT